MKKLLISSIAAAALALIGTPAFTADMPVKAPPVAPAPVSNWTGWYAGVNAGASFGHVKTDFNGAPLFGTSAGIHTFTPGFAGFDITHPSGFIGGGQIGYNWQYSPLIVVGLEADIQGALERDTGGLAQSFNFVLPVDPATQCGAGVPGGPGTPCTTSTSYTTQIDWFGTVRARIGYLWGDGAVLTYVTGGLAYGEVKISGANTVSGFAHIDQQGSFTGNFAVSQAFNHSQVNTGWVVGFGTEGKLLIPGWTYKIESLYMDLGTLDTTSVTSASSPLPLGGIGGVGGGQVHTHSHFTDGILRLGVNYQFH